LTALEQRLRFRQTKCDKADGVFADWRNSTAEWWLEVRCACGKSYKASRQASARLDWESGILTGEGNKRWRTFERLAVQHNKFVGESFTEMALRFGIKFKGHQI
jgi:hypothetical protein